MLNGISGPVPFWQLQSQLQLPYHRSSLSVCPPSARRTLDPVNPPVIPLVGHCEAFRWPAFGSRLEAWRPSSPFAGPPGFPAGGPMDSG